MSDVYRKWGHVLRYENGTTVRVEEAGQAFERDGVFQAGPLDAAVDRSPQLHPVEPGWQEFLTDLTALPVAIERLILSAGVAVHEIDGLRWTEESRRMHLSLVARPLRALIDLASFDIDLVRTIAGALARVGEARPAPSRLRLAPNVAAALLPALIGELAMEQRGSGLDGKGQAVETRAVTSDPPPNWYRPSYAIRPIRAWLNLRALPFGSVDRQAPLAVALLSPIEGHALRVLCVDGDRAFPLQVDACVVTAVSRDEPIWYPYAGGSFGTEMML